MIRPLHPLRLSKATFSRLLPRLLCSRGGGASIHGHGTGRLKAAVREALRGHPGIARAEDAPQNMGGAGVTVVTLR